MHRLGLKEKQEFVMFRGELTYFGVLKSITSWAKVCRELVQALIALGIKVNIYERKGFLYDKSFHLSEDIQAQISNTFKGDVVFTFENPKVYHYMPKQAFKIGFLVYEFSRLPDYWVKQINLHLNLVLVPSQFCLDLFIKSGVDPKKIKVLRYGFNPQYYYPAEKFPSKELFTFLCIANPHKREGIEFLLESYASAFTFRDPVKLRLKLSYMPPVNTQNYECKELSRVLEEFKARPSAPLLDYFSESLTEEEMGDLYRRSHAYISFSRSEAFGLCFLEALACGLPVAAILYSGQTDFLNTKNTKSIDFSMVKTRGEEYEWVGSKQEVSKPSIASGKEVMQDLFSHFRTQSLPSHLALNSEHFHWKNVAKDFLDFLPG